MKRSALFGLLAVGALSVALPLAAQQTAPAAAPAAGGAPGGGRAGAPAGGGRGGGGRGGAAPAAAGAAAPAAAGGTITPRGNAAYPGPPLDAAAVARGRDLFISTYSCASCHAPDLRGTDRGYNLRVSGYVLLDKGDGKSVGPQVRTDPGHNGAFAGISDAEAADLTQFMKTMPMLSQGSAEISIPAQFTVGDPVEGRTYFAKACATCHAVTAGTASSGVNLAGIASRVADPKTLQQTWLSPTTTKVVNAVVTLADGTKITGVATRIDEFNFTLTEAGGATRSFALTGPGAPKVAMTYPLAGHVALLKTMSDNDIHNVTAYLASLK